MFSQSWTQVDNLIHNTLCWGTCSSGSCKGMPGERRWTKQDRDGSCKTALAVACKLVGRNTVFDTDTGRRWHHYLECLHLLAWGRHHWSLCLQLHSRHCALCLQARQDNTFSDKLISNRLRVESGEAVHAVVPETCDLTVEGLIISSQHTFSRLN